MKKLLNISVLALGCICSAQMIIGDGVGTATDKTSVLLEFAKTDRGIILPYLRSLPASPTAGTIALDASNSTQARVKYFNGAWIDLSGQDANITAIMENASQPTNADYASAGVILGAEGSTADGVLVLESATMAMVLPVVDNVSAVHDPAPGMMVYINKVGSKRLAVYNGNKWSFWKP